MKTLLKIFLLAVFMGTLAMSCGKKSNSFGLTNFSHSGCKTGTETYFINNQAQEAQGDSETMEIKSENGFWIVKHINAMFNCNPDKLTADAAINGFTIHINENEEGYGSNCLCLYDLNYEIGPIAHGKYTVILNKMGAEYYRFNIDYTASVDTTIVIKKTIL